MPIGRSSCARLSNFSRPPQPLSSPPSPPSPLPLSVPSCLPNSPMSRAVGRLLAAFVCVDRTAVAALFLAPLAGRPPPARGRGVTRPAAASKQISAGGDRELKISRAGGHCVFGAPKKSRTPPTTPRLERASVGILATGLAPLLASSAKRRSSDCWGKGGIVTSCCQRQPPTDHTPRRMRTQYTLVEYEALKNVVCV